MSNNNDSAPYHSSAALQLLDETETCQRYYALVDELRAALNNVASTVSAQGQEFNTAYV